MQYAADKNVPEMDLDMAISLTGLGKFHFGLVVVAGGCIAATTADTVGLSFALPAVECELELSAVDKGLFSGASFLGMILTTHSWGFASDTFGRRGVLIISLGTGWLLSVLASLAPVFWLLLLLRFLAGAAYAGMSSTFYAYLAEFLPPEQRARRVAWSFLFQGAIFCLLPVTAWLTLSLTWSLDLGFVVLRSWRFLCLLNGFYALATCIAIFWFPESPKYLMSVGKQREALKVLSRIYSINKGRPESEYPVRSIRITNEDIRTTRISKLSVLTILKAIKDQLVPIFGRQHFRTTFIACILQFCFYSISSGVFLWLPDILNRMISYSELNPNETVTVCDAMNVRSNISSDYSMCGREMDSIVYLSSIALGVSYSLGYVLVGFMVKEVGKRKLLSILQLLSGISGFAIYWAPNTIVTTVLFILHILQPGIGLALLSATIVDLYPTHLRSAAVGIALTVGRLGASLTGSVLGFLFEYDCSMTIFGLATISFISVLLSSVIPKRDEVIKTTT